MDKTLAGREQVGTETPSQLYAGEANIVTQRGIVATNQNCAQYQVMALVNNELVIYDKTADDGGGAGTGAAAMPHSVLPHAMDTTATGYNAATESPYLVGGVFNFDALATNGATFDELKTALAASNSNLLIDRLF